MVRSYYLSFILNQLIFISKHRHVRKWLDLGRLSVRTVVFVPCTKARNTSGAPILLIYDGQGSHLTDRMLQMAEENNIELFQLPPHTTHRTQPLDVGPLQRRWMERCDDVMEETGKEIRKVDFIREYVTARALAFVPETIVVSAYSIPMCSRTKTSHSVTAPPLDHIFLEATPNALDTLRGKSRSRKISRLRRMMSLAHQIQAVTTRWKMIGKGVHLITQVSLQSDHIHINACSRRR